MNPTRLLPEEIFPAAIRLIYRELVPGTPRRRRRALTRLARFLAALQGKLGDRLTLLLPGPFMELLPPAASDWPIWGLKLRRRREQCGLSRRQLSTLAGLSVATIYDLECGHQAPNRGLVMQLQAVAQLALPSPDQRAGASSADPTPRETAEVMSRCWFASESDTVRMAREMAQRFNGAGGQIDQAFLYTDEPSAVAWCAVTAQPDYPQWQLPIDKLAQQLVMLIGDQAVDLIGLGAGEAKEEVRLARALSGAQRRHLRLFLLDISQPLLSAGYRHAATALGEIPQVDVFAIQGNFHNLPSYTSLLEPSSRRRVLCMFGDTFCQLENEVLFLRHNLGSLAPGDLLIIDVPLTKTPTEKLIEVLQKRPLASLPAAKLFRRLHEFLVGPFRRYVRGVQQVSLSQKLAPGTSPIPGSYGLELRAHVQTRTGPIKTFSLGGTSKRYEPTGLSAGLRRQGWEQVTGWRYAEASHPRLLLIFTKTSA